MWVIRGIATRNNIGSTSLVPCLFRSSIDDPRGSITLYLHETESRSSATLVKSTLAGVVDCLKERNVYGFSILSKDPLGALSCWIISISDDSWRFLDYVKSVRKVEMLRSQLPEHFAQRYFKSGNTDIYHVLENTENSLFVVDTTTCASFIGETLFQCACRAKDNWVGDVLYLPSRVIPGTSKSEGSLILHEVSFEDASKARAFIGRAAIKG